MAVGLDRLDALPQTGFEQRHLRPLVTAEILFRHVQQREEFLFGSRLLSLEPMLQAHQDSNALLKLIDVELFEPSA